MQSGSCVFVQERDKLGAGGTVERKESCASEALVAPSPRDSYDTPGKVRLIVVSRIFGFVSINSHSEQTLLSDDIVDATYNKLIDNVGA